MASGISSAGIASELERISSEESHPPQERIARIRVLMIRIEFWENAGHKWASALREQATHLLRQLEASIEEEAAESSEDPLSATASAAANVAETVFDGRGAPLPNPTARWAGRRLWLDESGELG